MGSLHHHTYDIGLELNISYNMPDVWYTTVYAGEYDYLSMSEIKVSQADLYQKKEALKSPRPPSTNYRGTWWGHQMEAFSALLAVCAGNSPVTGEFPTQRPVTQSFGVSLICALNKRLSEQTWGWWFETPVRPLWRHCNDLSALRLGITRRKIRSSRKIKANQWCDVYKSV